MKGVHDAVSLSRLCSPNHGIFGAPEDTHRPVFVAKLDLTRDVEAEGVTLDHVPECIRPLYVNSRFIG